MSTPPVRFFLFPVAAASAAVLCLTGCGKPDRIEVTATRAPFTAEKQALPGLSSRQRFAANDAQTMLRWEKPESWRMLPATEFRHVNFDFGPNREGECYLTLLSSQGGGVVENFNRWRKQMGAEALTPEQIAALPVKNVFARPAPFMDVSGTFTPGAGPMMTPGAPLAGYRMLGVIFEAPGFLFTIKMTGPAALVEAEVKNFDTFCASLNAAMPGPR